MMCRYFLQKKGGVYTYLESFTSNTGSKNCIKIVITLGIFQVKMEELQLELEETQRQLDQVKACENLTPSVEVDGKKSAGGWREKCFGSDLM